MFGCSKLLGIMLVMAHLGVFAQSTAALQARKDGLTKIWDGDPSCDDIRSSEYSTWLAAAMCAVAKCSPRAIKQIMHLGPLSKSDVNPEAVDNEAVDSVEVTLNNVAFEEYKHNVTHSDALVDEHNCKGDAWWPAAITISVIAQKDGKWLNDETAPLGVDNPTYMFQSDNTDDWDVAIGLWKLTGIGAVVEREFDKDKLWEWFIAARNSPVVIKTKGIKDKKYDDHKLDHPRAYTVKETEVKKDVKKVKLWNPVKTENKWYKLDDVFPEIDSLGHLIDFESIPRNVQIHHTATSL